MKALPTLLGMVVALILIAPATVAQTVDIDSQATKKNVPDLKPELDSAPITLAFTYSLPNQAYQAVGVGTATASATITVKCDNNNIIATGPGTALINLGEGATATTGGGSYDYQVQYQISVTRDLPGLKKFTCEYASKVGAVQLGSQAVPESNEAKDKFTVGARFFGVVQAKAESQIKQAGPYKEVPFQVKLDNFGNARTTIQFEIEERPSGKWSAVVPDDIILDSPAAGGAKTSDTAVFTVQTPYKNGWNNVQGTYRLKMITFATDDIEQKGIELKTNMLIRVRGVYVPSLEPMVMVGAILGTALLARLHKNE